MRIGNAIHRHVEAELWLVLTIFDKIPSQGTEVPRKKKKKKKKKAATQRT